jgi:hypothetical protein
MNGILTSPTADDVRRAINEFHGWDDEADPALNLLFAQYPKNTNIDHVLLKVVALNALYSTMIRVNSPITPTVYDVARHIVNLNIDASLEDGSEFLVDKIANTSELAKTLGKERQYNYSFATKYCSFHKPSSYPIYDSRVNEYLWHLRKLGSLDPFERNSLWIYSKFKKIVEVFQRRFGLQDLSFKQIDIFLYLEGGELLRAKQGARPINNSGSPTPSP